MVCWSLQRRSIQPHISVVSTLQLPYFIWLAAVSVCKQLSWHILLCYVHLLHWWYSNCSSQLTNVTVAIKQLTLFAEINSHMTIITLRAKLHSVL